MRKENTKFEKKLTKKKKVQANDRRTDDEAWNRGKDDRENARRNDRI